jgi:hypothetical protein
VNDYLIVILATLLAMLPLLVALAYRIGYNRGLRYMAEERRWEHWLIRNESNRRVRF